MFKKLLQKLGYLEKEKSFYDEIKINFHHFYWAFSQANNTNFFGRWDADFKWFRMIMTTAIMMMLQFPSTFFSKTYFCNNISISIRNKYKILKTRNYSVLRKIILRYFIPSYIVCLNPLSTDDLLLGHLFPIYIFPKPQHFLLFPIFPDNIERTVETWES